MTRSKYSAPPLPRRPSFSTLETQAKSMLHSTLPIEYGKFELGEDIKTHLTKEAPDERVARMTIVWDLEFDALSQVEEVIDAMRERGAAFILKVEEVKPS